MYRSNYSRLPNGIFRSNGFSAAEEYAGRRWNWRFDGGRRKKKERKGSRPANCLSSFLFLLGGNRKKNIQRGKLKQGEGECFSLFLFLKETEDFPFFTTAEERLEELNLFVALMESVSIQGTKIIVIKNSDRRLCLRKKERKRCEFPLCSRQIFKEFL